MLWGVTCYFNPAGFEKPLENLKKFCERLKKQNLPLLIVELALSDDEYVLDPNYCDKLIRVRSNQTLWHKEALLNIGIESLPAECDQVCWLDNDVLFDNYDWVQQTEDALTKYKVVQPFSHCIWLPPDVESVDNRLVTYPALHDEFNRSHSFGFGWTNFGKHALESRILYGHVGFAWAARRSIIESVGLYDGDIYAGSGDNLMAHGFVGHETMLRVEGHALSQYLIDHFQNWAEHTYTKVQGDVGYVNGNLNHLWHGSASNRRYYERLLFLRDINFDPSCHIKRSESGLYELDNAPAELSDAIDSYFHGRLEDNAPEDSQLCSFRDGFFDDEGDFVWSKRKSELIVACASPNLSFHISNNALTSKSVKQQVDIHLNGNFNQSVLLNNSEKVEVNVGPVSVCDQLSFRSDFDFNPSTTGATDTRNLSFMFWK